MGCLFGWWVVCLCMYCGDDLSIRVFLWWVANASDELWRHMHEWALGWLRLVGFLKWYVSFAKEPCKRDYILQKRPTTLKERTNRSHPIWGIHKGREFVCADRFSCWDFSLCAKSQRGVSGRNISTRSWDLRDLGATHEKDFSHCVRKWRLRIQQPPCPWDTHYQFSIKTLLSTLTPCAKSQRGVCGRNISTRSWDRRDLGARFKKDV